MTKIIFVNRYFYPDHSATSQMLSDLAFALAGEQGLEIHIVTSRQRYDNANADLPASEQIQGVYIHRVWTSVFGRQNLVGRAIDYLSFYFTAFAKMLALADGRSIIVAKTDPPLISVVAVLAAKIKSATLINWVQDLFPEVAAALGVKFVRGPVYALLKALRNSSLRSAQVNVVIGELMKQKLIDEGIAKDRIRVIHNWADGEQIKPIPPEQNPLRKEWGLAGKFVLGYSGNLGRSHDFNTILDVATNFKSDKEIVFIFIGGGANLEPFKAEVKLRGLENILFKPYQPRERLAESLSVADIHLVSLKPTLEGMIVPSKFYGVTAVGRPILFIGSPAGEIAKILSECAGGIVVPEGNSNALQSAISVLRTHAKDLAAKGTAARRKFETKYEKNIAIQKWKECLLALG